jgi:hypothetical protein
MELTHTFLTKAHDLRRLFFETTTLREFCHKLEKQAQQDPLRYPTEKYLGDGFECFIEILLALHPTDNRLGVYNYIPVSSNDNGVDGVGINPKLEPCVVQIKYRSNNQKLLTATEDKLAHLISDGLLKFDVRDDRENPKNFRHFVFTTAQGLHFYTDHELLKGKVKCFGWKELTHLVDHNLIFWQNAINLIQLKK